MAAPVAAPASAPGWQPFAQAGSVASGTFRALELEGVALIVANVDGAVLAYRDRCASCEGSLAAAGLSGPLLTCPACGSSFDLPRAGLTADGGAQLAPVPLLRRGGTAYEVALAR
jgi:nitrite reductase/ring-hydroxylating ferredoxin subunit